MERTYVYIILLEIKNFTKYIGNDKILDNISLNIERQTIVGFLLGSYIDFESDSLGTIVKNLKKNIINIILSFFAMLMLLIFGEKLLVLKTYNTFILTPWIITSVIVLVYNICKY